MTVRMMMVLMMMRCEMMSWNILKASQPASCRLCQLSICHTLTILRLEAIYGLLLCITNTALHGSEKKHCEVLLCAVGIVVTPSSVQPVVGGGCTRQCRSQLAVKLRQLSMFGQRPQHHSALLSVHCSALHVHCLCTACALPPQ